VASRRLSPAVAGCVVITLLALAGCKEHLIGSLSEKQANEALFSLNESGIAATKSLESSGKWSISVDSELMPNAIQVISASGVIRDEVPSLGEIFKKDGMFSSARHDRIREYWGISMDLRDTLNNMDGVIFAKVHLVAPQEPMGKAPTAPRSVSVVVKHHPRARIAFQHAQIRAIVAKAIPGMSENDVFVTMFPSDDNAFRAAADKSRQVVARIAARSVNFRWVDAAVLLVGVAIGATALFLLFARRYVTLRELLAPLLRSKGPKLESEDGAT